MNFDFTPFNPYVWSIFLLFLGLIVSIVKIYHHKYPGYPYTSENDFCGSDSSDPSPRNIIIDHERDH